jgi:hypothetical protein
MKLDKSFITSIRPLGDGSCWKLLLYYYGVWVYLWNHIRFRNIISRGVIVLYLSIYLSYFVWRHFLIRCSHVNSTTVDCGNLNFSNQFFCYFIVDKFNKSKSSTGLCNWITNYLSLLDLSPLCKMST